MTRRNLVKLLSTAPALLTIPSVVWAKAKKALPKNLLSEDDGLAKALRYKHDAKKAKERKNAKAVCDNCDRWNKCSPADKACKPAKNAKVAYAPCDLFAGKVVDAKGWCQSWNPMVKK